MVRAGFETTDPRTQTRTVVVKAAEDTGGRGWVLDVHCPEGAPASTVAHVHATWVETFEILEGTAAYLLGGEQRTLTKGENVLMPAGVPHVPPVEHRDRRDGLPPDQRFSKRRLLTP
jgi:mannose-6-phosphate isomerase-like protein (cupin superfamily)